MRKYNTLFSSGGGDGAEVIYALRNNSNLANLILEKLSAAGQNVRKAYQRRLPGDTSKDYYFIHRDTGLTEPIIVEYGFLDSSLDDVNQLKNNYKNYAEAVVKAIVEYTRKEPIYEANQYIVKKGDSLYSIANKYNTTVKELRELNNLTSDLLSIGQVLNIPILEKDYIEYVVVAGDSLYSIAKKYGTTVDEIKRLNNLTSNLLNIGQILKLPKTEVTEEPTNDIIYTVVKGDSLYSIAKKYNTTVDEIKKLNNLTSNLLNIGQVLRIPRQKNYIEYVVVAGDSLYKIANQYNTTVDEIKRLNNLTSNLLNIGQVLKI